MGPEFHGAVHRRGYEERRDGPFQANGGVQSARHHGEACDGGFVTLKLLVDAGVPGEGKKAWPREVINQVKG